MGQDEPSIVYSHGKQEQPIVPASFLFPRILPGKCMGEQDTNHLTRAGGLGRLVGKVVGDGVQSTWD